MHDLRADLHLHSALSPCAGEEMTPPAIAAAAYRAGVAVIAVTDHNSAGNAGAILAAAERAGLWAIPGMEVQTREEVHLLCYFPSLAALRGWEAILLSALPDLPNDERLFGPQYLLGPAGERLGSYPRLLLASAALSVDQVQERVRALGGVCLPAHVDKPSYSLLSQLGLPPGSFGPGLPFELSPFGRPDEVRVRFNLDPGQRFFSASDAHRLAEIGRRPALLRLGSATWEDFLLAVEGRAGRWLGMEDEPPGMR